MWRRRRGSSCIDDYLDRGFKLRNRIGVAHRENPVRNLVETFPSAIRDTMTGTNAYQLGLRLESLLTRVDRVSHTVHALLRYHTKHDALPRDACVHNVFFFLWGGGYL